MLDGIRQTTGLLNASYPAAMPRPARLRDTADPSAPSATRDDGADVLFQRHKPDTPRTGFGEGTVSVPGAAIRTLNRGLISARSLVPSEAEIRDQLRAAAADKRDAQTREIQDRQTRHQADNRTIPGTAAQRAAGAASDLVNAMNQAAETAQARLAGKTPSTAQPAATIQVNGQTLTYIRTQTETAAPAAQPRLNLRA